MDYNINQLVRSGVVLVIGLPIALGVTLSALPEGEEKHTRLQNSLKADLTEACLDYAFSKSDSKMERGAKDAVDERLGDGADYKSVCQWVLS